MITGNDMVKLIRNHVEAGRDLLDPREFVAESDLGNKEIDESIAISLRRLIDEQMGTAALFIGLGLLAITYAGALIAYNIYQAVTGNLYSSSLVWWSIWIAGLIAGVFLARRGQSYLRLANKYRSIRSRQIADKPS